MVMRNKKGFTLVEILAVLVVLLVIVLIAVNIINSRIKEAKKNSVEVNANNYVKAVNGVAALSQNIGEDMESGTYQVRDLNKSDIKLSGDKPRKGYVILENYEVKYGCLRYEDYSALIFDGKTVSIDKDNCLSNSFFAEYAYTGSEGQFTAAVDGTYKLEVWGAQGGNYTDVLIGGYGGYSSGYINLKKGDKLYVTVGGQGDGYQGYSSTVYYGGWNGGGNSYQRNGGVNPMAGGGATHIATKSGLLSTLSNFKGTLDSNNNVYRSDTIIIVAGGGAGAYGYGSYSGKSGGGYIGGFGSDSSLAGSQTSGVSFGRGSDYNTDDSTNHSGGGGGFYGGTAYWDGNAGGGSGYIASTKLNDGVMYCYGCSESSNTLTKTISTSCAESTQTENCAKIGSGYAKISYIGSN